MDCTLHRHLLEGYLDGELGFRLDARSGSTSCIMPELFLGSSKLERLSDGGRKRLELADHRAPERTSEANLRKLVPQTRDVRMRPWFQRSSWAIGGCPSSQLPRC